MPEMTPIPVIMCFILFYLLATDMCISMLTEMFSWRPLRMASILHLCFPRMLPGLFYILRGDRS